MAGRYAVVVYVVTAGLHGDNLGADEQEVVLFSWLVVDVANTKVVVVQQHFVKPRGADVNENLLSDTCRSVFQLTEESVNNGQSLENVLEELDQFVKARFDNDGNRNFFLVTDGQFHLRQVLHPEATKKNLSLPDYFFSFFDLRKEFRRFYHTDEILSIQDMLNCIL
ncbi:epithelial splicing regulatory protein 1-like [Limulus polyphemus]|uniref:Epithelial splicing regulatory protein 1-like n=1 Tax=Limulus polyphemus TaxID=6850 RepID=A0ABM1BY36_LIMPO|nr:epithelial splicing regulatory protein 1-like [Limulus polyphemus]